MKEREYIDAADLARLHSAIIVLSEMSNRDLIEGVMPKLHDACDKLRNRIGPLEVGHD